MIIGVTGKKQSGKDTIGNFLIRHKGFHTYKFAEAIKSAVADIFLWDDRYINGELKEVIDPRWGISPRQAQQVVGTELFRECLPETLRGFRDIIGNNIWVKRFQYWYETLPTDTNVVITDVRFLNEAEAIREMGGVILKVHRKNTDYIEDSHVSEIEMCHIAPHFNVVNNGNTLELEAQVGRIYNHLKEGD